MRQTDMTAVWGRRDALAEHLGQVGLRPPLQRLLLHLWDTRDEWDGEAATSLRQVPLRQLAAELGCSVRAVTDWRDDLIAYGLLRTVRPERGRTLILVVDWSAVWSAERVSDAPRRLSEWVREQSVTDARDAADHAARDTAADAAPHAADNAARDAADHAAAHDTHLIEGMKERERENNHSFLQSQGADQEASDQPAMTAADRALGAIPPKVWDATLSDAGLFSLLRTWRAEHRETLEAAGWDGPRCAAAVLATRAALGRVTMPLRYLRTCLESPSEEWLQEAERWIRHHLRGSTYAPHGTPR